MNLLALAVLVTSLLLFIVFHFVPTPEGDEKGWQIWSEIAGLVTDPEILDEPLEVIAVASFICFSVLVVGCPFLVFFLRRSRLLWWLAVVMSGIATVGFWGFIVTTNTWENLGQSGLIILATPVANLVGLLLLRGERRMPVEGG